MRTVHREVAKLKKEKVLNERLTTLELLKKRRTLRFFSGLQRSIEANPLKSMAK